MDKQHILHLTQDELFQQLSSSVNGLTNDALQKHTIQYGENVLKSNKHSAISIFIRQFKSILILLLCLASFFAFLLRDYVDGTIMLLIIIINTFLSFFQEYKSERAVEKLSKLISKEVEVRRNGKTLLISEEKILPGDIVILKEGDIVPADCKLLTVEGLELNESQLTGESVAVAKTIQWGIHTNDTSFIFAGSTVEKGDCTALIYATGSKTELGKIATLSSGTQKVTQYEKSLQAFSSFLMKVIFFTLIITFITKVAITRDFSTTYSLLLFIIVLAISVVPEALPVIATITMSQGALRLSRKHVVVKRLSSLEDLGNITILCTDKTGTLTENKIGIEHLVASDPILFQEFATATIDTSSTHKKKVSNSFDYAFSEYIPQNIKRAAKRLHVVKEVPFDPKDRRRRIILSDTKNNIFYYVVMGSLETLLTIAHSDKAKEYKTTDSEEGKQGLRHLAIAYKEILYTEKYSILDHEDKLELLGYVSLTDPLRKDSKHTIQMAEKLGIAIKILTGDSKEVSLFVAKEVGLLKDSDVIYTGDELEKMSSEELKRAVNESNVFARVSPEQKYMIIKALKENNIVGYQGDGINDAPSLKLADVAIAVNTATDVAKENADIILLHKDLINIITGIQYGRAIFVNINKYIKYTMVGNFGNFFALIFLYLLNTNLPLLAVQLLLTNLLTDVPLIAISSDTVDLEDVAAPQKYSAHAIMFLSLILGTFTAFFELIFFVITNAHRSSSTNTSLFLFITFLGFMIIFSIRNKKHFWKGIPPSRLLIISIMGGFLLTFILPYIPFTANIFSFMPLAPKELFFIIAISLVYLFGLDLVKLWYYTMIKEYHI